MRPNAECLALFFVDWHRRGGHGCWEESFEVWAGPLVRNLAEAERRAVRAIAEAELIARGVLTPGLDYEPCGG